MNVADIVVSEKNSAWIWWSKNFCVFKIALRTYFSQSGNKIVPKMEKHCKS